MEYLLFTEQDILERVDEYALYCYYLGYEVMIGGKTLSPDALRAGIGRTSDNSPSFGVFERTRRGNANYPNEFLWKDNSANVFGDIFDLVRYLFKYETKRQAILHICAEFGLGGDSSNIKRLILPEAEKKYADPVDIAVKSKPYKRQNLYYWNQFNINPKILDGYYTSVINCYWIAKNQKVPSYPKGPGYAYRIGQRYQLYFPYAEKEKKFRQNLMDIDVHGFEQLQFHSDTCIITKARKDVMCLRSFNYDSIAPRSESTMLPPECIAFLKRKYKRILILFDNDGKHNGDKYEFDKIFVPKQVDADKDPSDFCLNHGPEQTAMMLHSIIK